MKKRFLTLIVTLTAMLMCIFGFSACNKVEFKVNFVVDGAVYATIDTNGKEIIKMPENPEKDDYTFDGWYWDENTWQTPFTANSLLDAPLSSDMSVYCKWKPNTISVESITLNKTEISLHENDIEYLTATILPENATDTSVVWQSSNASIVTVENGTITAVGYGTAIITVTTIDGNKTATCAVEIIEDKITFNTLFVEDETAYGKVSNATATFSFIKEIVEHGNATYNVYKEITCETEIKSKSISLNIGDNTVYVLQTVGKNLKLYTVTVRRRPMYEVTFNANGGSSVQSQTIEEDSFASAPATQPTRTGYTFKEWDYDFATPITKATTIKASWTANTNTPYKVEYYLQNLENDNYTLQETVNKTGTTDTTANAEIKTFTHFTPKKQTVSGNIAPNGSTVLKVYYTRDQYTVTFNGNGGTLTSGKLSQTVKYGGSVTPPAFEKTGYTFDGYDKTNYTNISESFTITASWKINQYTLTIVYGNGQEDKVITQDYNTPIESIFNPERAGYVMDWDKAIPTKMPAQNLTVTATWQSIFTLSNGVITGLTEYGKANCSVLSIPSKIDGEIITSIGSYAFEYCDSLTSVVIGDSVTSIGEDAFYNCDSLTSVYITDIEAWCNISFRDFYANPLYYAKNLYLNNELVTELVIPNTVTEIKAYAFYNCSNLTSVVIGDSVTSIGKRAFAYCNSLTEMTLPFVGASKDATGYQAVFGYIFGYTTSSSSDTISGATYQYYDSSSSSSYKYYHYYIPTSLKKVTITSVTSIGEDAFYNCDSLTSVY
ncbi:MAG: leucine-rich repeat protein, partial [Clostridia bacterium]|nr:leucine-rich repeat protein [Clostridia bacterium]